MDDRRAESIAILRAVIDRVRAGEITGLMVIAELPAGAYAATEIKMTGCANVAERIGRIRLLRADLDGLEAAAIAAAQEDIGG